MSQTPAFPETELEWVQFRKDTLGEDADSKNSHSQRFTDKVRQNPLIPIGVVATTLALGYGLICFKNGNTLRQQFMMRARVGAQGFTIIALMAGIIVNAPTKK